MYWSVASEMEAEYLIAWKVPKFWLNDDVVLYFCLHTLGAEHCLLFLENCKV